MSHNQGAGDDLSGHQYEDRYDSFFREMYRVVVRVVMGAGASLDDAMDAVSEAMLLAYKSWPLLDNPAAWVFKVALRTSSKTAKRDRIRPKFEERAGRRDGVDRIPEDRAEDPDECKFVREVLLNLPAAQREVMALTVDGFDPTEIAEIVGKSPATVRSNLREARRKLRDELRRFW